jgi:hypothetical protein
VKFVVSPVYLEGKEFGYKRVALLVFRWLLDCTCVIFGDYCIFFSNIGMHIWLLGDFLTNKLKMEGLVWYMLHNTLQIQQQKTKTFIQFMSNLQIQYY